MSLALHIEYTENLKRKIQQIQNSPNTGDKVRFINTGLVRTKQRRETYCRCSDYRSNNGKTNPDRKINKNDNKGKSLGDS